MYVQGYAQQKFDCRLLDTTERVGSKLPHLPSTNDNKCSKLGCTPTLIQLVLMSTFQARTSSAAFYTSAIKTLRIQVAALTVASLVWLVMIVLMEPKLGGVGASTPEMPLSIMVRVLTCWRSPIVQSNMVIVLQHQHPIGRGDSIVYHNG